MSWKKQVTRTLVFISMFLGVACVLNHAENFITQRNVEELRSNLRMVIDQNMGVTSQALERYLFTAKRIAMHLDSSELTEERVLDVINRQKSTQPLLKFMRVGFIYPDGHAIASDGSRGNLAIRDYFHRSMRGEMVIAPVMTSYLGDKHVSSNVFSAPVYNNDKSVAGVVFVTVPNDVLLEHIGRSNVSQFGSMAIVDDNGEVIAAGQDSTLVANDADLLGFVSLDSGNNTMENWQSRSGHTPTQYMYFERDGGKYLYFAPVSLSVKTKPVYSAILVDKAFIDTKTKGFTGQIHYLMLSILAIAGLGAFYFIWDTHRQEKKRRRELETMAYGSRLTGGPNLDHFLREVPKKKASGYVVYMDIRDFEVIRSVCGVKRSEDLLRKVWEHVNQFLGAHDCAAHINNDYFAIFYALTNLDDVSQRLTDLSAELRELSIKENVPQLTAFYGLSAYNVGDETEMACSNANIAHFSIMNAQDKMYAVYGKSVTEEFVRDRELEQSFDSNIEEKRFEVWYQPKIDCFTDKVIGAEALVRLRTKDGMLVPPGKFIPLFERDGLIRTLDEYVFKTVCQRNSKLKADGKPLVPVSINLSRASLYYGDVVERYSGILFLWDMDPQYVPIEITETAISNSRQIQEVLKKFGDHGFKLHLDDFGSGYSSLSLLNTLKFDNVKIDKSLVDYIGDEKGDNLLKHIIRLCRELGMHITAEGVEKAEQIAFLKKMDCHCIQGYYYSKPLPYKEFLEYQEKHS